MIHNPHDIILRPYVTEKAMRLAESDGTYTFVVERAANKHQIRHAVETLFKVDVVGIRTLVQRGKARRMVRKRIIPGRRPSWKKALVTLKEGQRIDII